MKVSRPLKIAAALALGLATVGVAWSQSMKPENAIKGRQAVQRVILLNFQPLGAMAKGSIPFDAEIAAANALRIKLISEMPIPSYYADGTETAAGVKTRALPEIWFDKKEFEEKLNAFRGEAAKLVEAARSGNESAFKTQVGATSKACDNCHDKFRA
jgi:cytochrome c556